MTKNKRERRTFTTEFKHQMVQLYQNGKPGKDIIKEYRLTPSSLDRWINQNHTSGSFKEKDNKTAEQLELEALRKQNKQLLMENDIFKASGADTRTKVKVVKNNLHKYSISAMCNVLQLSRATYYYEAKQAQHTGDELSPLVKEIFRESRQNYGTRKIKVELKKLGYVISRRRIGRIMQNQGLVSNYTIAQFKPQRVSCNEEKISNELDRQFNQKEELAVVVSDLTYVRVNKKWNYVCLLVDLFNREIIGHSAGQKKDAALVSQAFATVKANLNRITLFHTDRGNEFKNKLIHETLETFQIKRSLSAKGCPYDNAVAEATYKIFKTEFVRGRHFASLEELTLELNDYVNWFNNVRIHGTLDYLSPVQYRQEHLKKIV
ncbi:IS3 family transposase [Bacillus cereus group sp. TH43LC]|uniref:IS3 family transposase n=1 Tax=Bacillus TaxID=1386 RepID=UPI000A2F688C|nr:MULTISPECIES: IS3 family transposase [Bacillus]MBE7143560.1 IS3 family transposase [Bacillus paranthracis]MCQ6525339.1 IS3 family transposase [Bacillus paranthracis]MCU5231429.1 IS3 family transposase [Bacillus paranthracis]MCY9253151.1 IS3 family transposase [Bacillus paranthracis]MDA1497259.1 IS3 family transposase [Bacillus cereus group sp. TH41-1LC]